MSGAGARRALPLLSALVGAALVLALALRAAPMSTDMADFLPRAGGERRLLLATLTSGPASRLVLVGIDGAPPDRLARLSRGLAGAMAASGWFSLVANGAGGLGRAERRALFRYRYLLAPAPARDFSVPALRRALRGVRRGLLSSASLLVARYGLADPTGAFPATLARLAGTTRLRRVGGVWFAPRAARALLVAQSRAGALDPQAAAAMERFVRRAFAGLGPGGARLLLGGPAVLGAAAARVVRGDVGRLALLSTLAVLALLFWRFRSLAVVAAIAVPVMLSVAAATLALALAFGTVPALAFGFGMTMLGVSVDYPVLLIGHRKPGEAAAGTLQRIGAALALTVAAAALGLCGMVFSGFPWLEQLGLFAVAGLLGAYGATRLLLPRLIVAADLAPVPAGDPARFLAAERWRRFRRPALAVPAAAALVLLIHPPRFAQSLARLSPVPAAARRTDAALRAALGAAEPGVLVLVRGTSAEAVLRREERLSPLLAALRARHAITGAAFAARLLPSAARQRARAAALPDASTLASRLARARRGLHFRAGAFARFRAAVAASRALAPLTPATLPGPVLRARLAPLLFARGGVWNGAILFSGVADPAALATALAGRAGVRVVEVARTLDALAAFYARRAGVLLGLGAGASLLLLAAVLRRERRRLLRVAGSLAAALLVTLAVLDSAGVRISFLHILALQLVLGIGLDYALFFSRPRLDAEERIRTLRTLITCNGLTLAGFGLLAFARTPLLREIGVTAGVGALAAMVFAFLFAGPPPGAEAAR